METYDKYLEHHGIKGQKWGIRRTPEQLGYKTGSSEIISKLKKRGSVKSDLEIRAGSKEKKLLKVKEIAEKRAERKAKEDIARREKILQDPTLLYKHRKEFSSEEIKKAMLNIRMEQELQQLSVSQLSAAQVYLQTAVKYAETGIQAYNKAANIYNAFNKDGKTIPVIGGGKKKKNKDKSKDDDD